MRSPRLSPYHDTIREILALIGRVGYAPGQVEAWIRLECGTLDGLSFDRFRREVEIACQCIDADPDGSRSLAESYNYDPGPVAR